jgi:DNA-binding MarR family transcriptional regulator
MLDIFDSLCILLAKTEQKHYIFTKKLLVETDLNITPGQMTVLYTLYKGDGIPITELSKKVFLDNSTLTGLLDRLEKLGLVVRSATSEDRRCYHIYLTDKAKSLQNDICHTMAKVEHLMTTGCSEAEVATFRKVLDHIFRTL